jgi:murein DD-endopeptidase MepM/ murein hydrolase activator NlpD
VATERLLGSGDEDAQARALLPFTRSLTASGTVEGPLADSAASAGAPRSAMLEALRALDTAMGRRAPQDGDTFYVRWEQSFAVEGHPIGVGRVLALELKTEDGLSFALHRFRPRDGVEQFFLADGEAATPPAIALPLEDVNVSSHFGYRRDPLTRSAGLGTAVGPLPGPRTPHRAFAGFGPRLFMHEGVDFAVPQGTPIYAASDGVVSDARRNGGYGNWVRIEHTDGVATAYAHLSRFAPGIKPGAKVVRGELVAFSGNTGRSTGPHLHFEVLNEGKPVDPLTHATIAQLGGADLERFQKQVAAEERERDAAAPAESGQGVEPAPAAD